MKVSITTAANQPAIIVSALLYAFPKKGNAPDDYTLTVEGQPTKVAQTGGGKYPRYTYLMINGTSYYLPKNVVPLSGTDVKLMADEPKSAETKALKTPVESTPEPGAAKPEVVEPTPEPVAAPADKKPRRSKK